MADPNKKFWHSSEFTGAGQAQEALAQSAFLNMTTNATGYSYEAKARVITKPLAMSNRNAAGENNTPSSTPCSRIPGRDRACKEAARAVAAVEAADPVERFGVHKFFARIELEGASPSEHELISNVCSISTASDKLTTACNTGLHVLCYTKPMTTPMPKIGDIVRVQLRVGDVGRDLQHADFTGLEQVSEISEVTIGGSLSCAATLESTMKAIFDDTYIGSRPHTSLGANQAMHVTEMPEGDRTINLIVIHFTAGGCGSGRAQQTIGQFAAGMQGKYKPEGVAVPCRPGASLPNVSGKTIVCQHRPAVYADIGGYALEEKRMTSIHYAVDQGGNVVQGVLEKDVATHAGGSTDRRAIGIEINGSDDLERHPECSPSMFTPTLMNALVRLVREIAARHNIPLDRQHIKGHDELTSPAHRRDPGTFPERQIAAVGHESGWKWDIFMNALKNGTQLAQDQTSGDVTAA
jgi:hypothetical protein